MLQRELLLAPKWQVKKKKIHYWVYKASQNSYQLHFLSNEISKSVETGMLREDF